jgi:hypothetical protein
VTRRALLLSLGVAALAPPAAHAAPPELLLVGGGWGPEGTQASIEAHVAALSAALPPRTTTLLFADGASGAPAVQESTPAVEAAAELLGLVFDRTDGLQVRYRPTTLKPAGRASKQDVLQQLARLRARGDVVLFGVGHGAPAAEGAPAALELWGPKDRLEVPELARALDAKPAGGRVALVLGHCHSGAFADVMYVGGDPQAGLARPTRCAFAAVPADREAAGCTPDVADPGARAYMSALAAALAHPKADLDGDGQTTLAELHAGARLHDGTVDVPVSTSELWLAARLEGRAPDLATTELRTLVAAASPAERAVLQAVLPKRLRGASPAKVAKAAEQLAGQITVLDEQIRQLADRREEARRVVVDALLLHWPELSNPYHPRARQLLAGDAAEVVAFLSRHRRLDQLRSLDKSLAALDQRLLAHQRRAARLERWLRAAQRVANEAAVRAAGDRAAVDALDALVACEALSPLPPASRPASP